jgi:hypothetical protein
VSHTVPARSRSQVKDMYYFQGQEKKCKLISSYYYLNTSEMVEISSSSSSFDVFALC